jgi:chromate transporter
MSEPSPTRDPSFAELALVFLKLGTIAFGGPAAHFAVMQNEFVERRRWITQSEFLDRIAAASLIPGPSSTEVAIFIGQLKGGWRGLVIAGSCFIIPAALMVSVIAWAYVRFGSLPCAEGVLTAIKPVVVAIIVQAIGRLSRTALRTPVLVTVAVLAAILNLAGISPIQILLIAAIISASAFSLKNHIFNAPFASIIASLRSVPIARSLLIPKPGAKLALLAITTAAVPVPLIRLFLSFLKIGSIVFGSGYVLLAFLQTEFVEHLHWLTDKQLIDSVAVGQFTPGPVFTTATFIGYIVAGWKGALLATVAIFLPGFLLVAVSGPLIPWLRRSKLASSALDGVIAASLALMAVVVWQLGKASIVNPATLIIFLSSLAVLLGTRISSAWLILAAAVTGFFLH